MSSPDILIKITMRLLLRKGLGGGDSPEYNGGDYHIEADTSPRNDNAAEQEYHNMMNQRAQPNFGQLQPNFSIQVVRPRENLLKQVVVNKFSTLNFPLATAY